MGVKQLELKLLKPIPAKIKKTAKTRVYDQEPAGLERAYGDAMKHPDDWHVELKVRSRYCSMDELKNWLMANDPTLDLSVWSMSCGTQPGQPVQISAQDRYIEIPWPQYENLKTDHIDPIMFERPVQAWSIDLNPGDASWLSPVLPAYIQIDTLMKLVRMRMEYARKSAPDTRGGRISMAGYSGAMPPDIIGFLADGWAEARYTRSALYARIVE